MTTYTVTTLNDELDAADTNLATACRKWGESLMARNVTMTRVRSLVVVDQGVEDWHTLMADLAADAKLVVLDPARDGVQAIVDAVASLHELAAIHIVSHGNEGEVRLGTAILSSASLDHYADALARIGRVLSDGGDILLYGCEVARGETGRAFIEKLADITGADVAAATHPVGASTLGGSFDLDVSIGAITAATPFAPRALVAFSGLMAGGNGGLGHPLGSGNLPGGAGGVGTNGDDGEPGQDSAGDSSGGGGGGAGGGDGGHGGALLSPIPGGSPSPGAGGGAGGNNPGDDGVAGGSDSNAAGGGGGGGAHGLIGGLAGGVNAALLRGGTGGAGGNSTNSAAGGGGAGGYGALNSSGSNDGTIRGGDGGRGGGSSGGGGGSGGDGGYGAVLTGTATNSGTIQAGDGGRGGNSVVRIGGNGGQGGVGVEIGSGFTFSNFATVEGGDGGARGTSTNGNGTTGNGGAGVVGAGISIINAGTIAGGKADAGNGAQANAITFTGGTNAITFNHGGTSGLTGNIDVASGASLQFAQSNGVDTTVDSVIAGGGSISKAGADTISLSGSNTYAGGTTIAAGVLSTSADANLGASSGGLTLNGGTLQATASFTSARSISDTAASGIDVTGSNNLTLSGAISGTSGLTKTGTGTLTLSNTGYAGTVTIASGGGTLSLAGSALTSAANIVTLGSVIDYADGENNPATITISSNTTQLQVTTGSAAQSGQITQDSSVRGFEKIGAGTLALTNALNDYAGATTIAGGTLAASSSHALGDGSATNTLVFNGSGATLRADGAIASPATRGVTLTTAATIDAHGNAVTIAGVISGAGTLDVTNSTATAADVTLSNAGNAIGTLGGVSLGAGSFSLTDSVALTLNGMVTAGTVSLTGSEITQSAAGVITAPSLAATATAGAVDLSQATNSITTFAADVGSVALLESNGFSIGSAGGVNGITAGTKVQLKAGGTISQTEAITAGGLAVVTSAGDISLASVTNATSAVAFNAVAGNVSYKTSTDLTVSTVGAIGTLSSLSGATASGTLTLITTGAAITQTAGATVTATNLALVAATGVTLTAAGNDVTNLSGLVTGAGNFTYTDASAFTVSGNAAVNPDPTVGIRTTNGAISLNGTQINLAANLITDNLGNASTVTLTGPVVLTGASPTIDTDQTAGGNAGNVTFTSTVNGNGAASNTLIVDARETVGGLGAGGAVLFGGTVGATTRLAGLAVAGSGVTFAGTNNVDTLAIALSGLGNGVSYTDADSLDIGMVGDLTGITTNGGAVALTAGGALTVSAALSTTAAVTLNSSGTTTLGVALSGIGSLTTDAAGTTAINGGAVTTTGAQTYNDAVTLGAATTLTGGSITLASDLNNNGFNLTVTNAGASQFGGNISGAGGLTKNGAGVLELEGSNTYGGTTTINAGTLRVGGGAAIPDFSTGSVVLANFAGAVLELSANERIGSLAGGGAAGGNVTLDANTLTVGDSSSTSYAGVISGIGGLTKQGSGTLTLSGTDLYTGATKINGGTLIVDGSIASSSLTTVANGATLGGHGTAGAVTVASGGTLSPGNNSIAILNTGDLTLSSGAIFKVALGGTMGSAYDQVHVSGSVSLAGATLTGSLLAFDPETAGAATFTIIDNDGTADAVSGAFTGLAEGTHFNIAGHLFTLSYHGGDGNDVVLSAANDAPTIAIGSSTIAVTEDVAAAVTGFSFADIDAGAAPVTVTLAVASGTLAAGSSGGVTVGGTPGALTLSGRVADINAFIAASHVTFTTAANATSDVILTVTVDDNGHSGSDPGLSGTATSEAETTTLTFDVTAVNDAPTVGVPVKLPAIEANSAAHLITQAQLLANADDVDGPSLTAINLQITSGQGTLADHHDGSWSYTPATNDDTGVTFSFSVTDGVAAPVADTATLDIVPAQAAPQTGSPGDDTFTAVTGNAQYDAGLGVDTITFGFKLTDATVTYDGNKVIIDGPSSHTVLTGFEIYKFTDGTVNNHDSDPLVDDLYYYSHNNDVWLAGADADAHYHTTGWHEGRDPDAFFSTSTYLSLNPDVKAAGVDPLVHFDQYGWKEGRAPSIAFNDAAYLNANPDVAAAHVDPFAHFLQYGAQEGRQPTAFDHLLAANGFDYVYYLQHNPDVAAAHVDPLQHYETIGWKEGRNPNALFDDKGYLAAYADVAAAGINPLDHYNQSGWNEGRDPSANFDTTDYLSHYTDVANAQINPLIHFLQFGQAEGRSPFADGHFG